MTSAPIICSESSSPPDGKQDEVVRLQADGRTVAMVGDAINDAPP